MCKEQNLFFPRHRVCEKFYSTTRAGAKRQLLGGGVVQFSGLGGGRPSKSDQKSHENRKTLKKIFNSAVQNRKFSNIGGGPPPPVRASPVHHTFQNTQLNWSENLYCTFPKSINVMNPQLILWWTSSKRFPTKHCIYWNFIFYAFKVLSVLHVWIETRNALNVTQKPEW